ncbi:MAG: ammonia channel protein, partial [Proteobacteria bacterium]|nr:ammonia channel protein [Pseudomonadota bacterium]
GIFASTALSDGGLLTGNPGQLVTQVIAIVATYAYCGIGTFIILSILNAVVGLRVDEEEEEAGLDLTQHAESAYTGT